jgi:hypothetical protein
MRCLSTMLAGGDGSKMWTRAPYCEFVHHETQMVRYRYGSACPYGFFSLNLLALMEASTSVQDLPGESAIDRLKRGMWAYITFGLEHPDHYRFAFILQRPETSRIQGPNAAYDGLKGRIARCITAGHFADGDLDLMAQSLWAPLHGVTSLLIQRPLFPWTDQTLLVSEIVDAAVSGLRKIERT